MRASIAIAAGVLAAGCGSAGGGGQTAAPGPSTSAATAPAPVPTEPGALGRFEFAVWKCDCHDPQARWPLAEGEKVECPCGASCHCDHGPLGRFRVDVVASAPLRAGGPAQAIHVLLRGPPDAGASGAPPSVVLSRGTGEEREVVDITDAVPTRDGDGYTVAFEFPAPGRFNLEVSGVELLAGAAPVPLTVPLEVR
ncbi:MAG: hypothetical protein L0216_11850 [Planctomycetales bacterium]|nr:hypothetical protein [Planctomycetales bacterium]